MPEQKYHCRLKSYIQPFERLLAIRELAAIAGNAPEALERESNTPLEFTVNSNQPIDRLSSALTFWELITPTVSSSESLLTLQVRRESTINLVRNGVSLDELNKWLPFSSQAVPLSNRRNLRYGPHGIHEYRGKFFPQLVKALLNISQVTTKSIVLDPMCGSGTTLVEACLAGATAYGIDQNPLSVHISRTKSDILKVNPTDLWDEYLKLKASVLALSPQSDRLWFATLSNHDQVYLRQWFPNHVLGQLDQIKTSISKIADSRIRSLFEVSLSNIIRTVSWQKNDDLRVRKEIRADVDNDAIELFVTEVGRSVKAVVAFLIENNGNPVGNANVIEGDAKIVDQHLSELKGKVDVCITSPPYATALPYLDTDRLSLYFLGLLSRADHRKRDYNMIGNREITSSLKKAYWDEYSQYRQHLTPGITSVIDKIESINSQSQAGFRRQNLSALLARYFLDMRKVLDSHKHLLKKGAFSFFVVGNNHTFADGERIDINTDDLLGELGSKAGLFLEDSINMELLTSRDIFKKNAGNTEKILIFRKL